MQIGKGEALNYDICFENSDQFLAWVNEDWESIGTVFLKEPSNVS